MFTGIVEAVGTVVDRHDEQDSSRLTVVTPLMAPAPVRGESVAVDGVCLTVVGYSGDRVEFDVMGETLRRSTIGRLRAGNRVNLERPLAVNGRIGGHVVQGHVDGVATVLARQDDPRWSTLRFSIPAGLARYVAHKGSVTVAGVSLTVAEVSDPTDRQPWFEVGLIPTTLTDTTLGGLVVGGEVNVEVDVLAKYLQRARSCDEAAGQKEESS